MINSNKSKVNLEVVYFLIFGTFEFDRPNTGQEYYQQIKSFIHSRTVELWSF